MMDFYDTAQRSDLPNDRGCRAGERFPLYFHSVLLHVYSILLHIYSNLSCFHLIFQVGGLVLELLEEGRR